MDFNYLIELAKENEERSKKDGTIKFSTNVSRAKKETKIGPKGEAVKKVIEKKLEDQKKQEIEFKEKKHKLLELRAKDKKSNKRVLAMINRTKGASKAVLDEAKDITTAKGEEQCDADDYGYESTISQQIFDKLKDRYSNIPDDERLKFNKTVKSDINDIKARVMSSLKKQEEEELGIRKRKRNRKKGSECNDDDDEDDDNDACNRVSESQDINTNEEREMKKKKKRKRKTTEEFDNFINDGDAYESFRGDRNVDQDVDRVKISEHKEKNKLKKSKDHSKLSLNMGNVNKSDKYSNFKYNKEKSKESENVDRKENVKKSAPPPLSFEELLRVAQKKQAEPLPMEDPLKALEKLKKEREQQKEDRPMTAKEKKELEEDRLRKLRRMWKLPTKDKEKDSLQNSDTGKKDHDSPQASSTGKKDHDSPQASNTGKKDDTTMTLKPNVKKENPKPIKDLKSQEKKPAIEPPQRDRSKYFALPNGPKNPTTAFSSKEMSSLKNDKGPVSSKESVKPQVKNSDSLPKSRPFPPYHPTKKNTALMAPKRRLDSDDEYDSEMDDFIDDGDVGTDYSSEIAKMFKYDKSRYRDIDEDVEDMEASYSQVEKEEYISSKIGLMEDLADIKREEDEKKRKKMLMKANMKMK